MAVFTAKEVQWLSTFAAAISGGSLSAFFSLFMGRVIHLHQVLYRLLALVKAWDSRPNSDLAHKMRIEIELLTDSGFRYDSSLIQAIRPMPQEIEKGRDHGELANKLYSLLQESLVLAVWQAMLFPDYPHSYAPPSDTLRIGP
jgi:hypothetical protein